MHYSVTLTTRTSILCRREDVEFVLDCTGRHDRAVTKIIIFSVSIVISCTDSVGHYSPNNEVSNHAKICGENAL